MPEVDPIRKEFEYNRELRREDREAEIAAQAPYLLQERQLTQAALIEQLDPNKVIENIALHLRGQIKDPITGEIKKIRKPLMNEQGIGDFISSVSSIVNINTTISALDERMINRMINQMDASHRRLLRFNWEEYESNQFEFDLICNICVNLVYLCLRRSLGGGERGFLGRVTMESISTPRMQQMQPRQRWWHKFKL